jgi:lipopolysaccharide biosynthesis protein
MTDSNKVRPIAFYLPQYHPIPENDIWWGKGFTEWTNVAKATPLFKGHQQPKLPADLGFYDLRVPEVREEQARLAKLAGIEGFCYWHYWFGHGRKILERPFAEVLASGKPDFPFCLCWANESWTGIWHGAPGRTLIEQLYPGLQDLNDFFQDILPALRDRRYLTVHGKPILMIYNPQSLPDAAGYTFHLRQLAEQSGLPGLYLIGMTKDVDLITSGFDAYTPKHPSGFVGQYLQGSRWQKWRKYRTSQWTEYRRKGLKVFDYDHFVELAIHQPLLSNELPCVLTNWDNTPRSGRRGIVLQHATPKKLESYLEATIQAISNRPVEERLLFLKAWNEWAEGNYLEPDAEFGMEWVEACQSAFNPPLK